MGQALENLLSNAVKYGNSKPVTLSVEKTDTHAIFRVQDLGIGILREKQTMIFDRFERVTESENIGGLGLGLYITKQIVDAHQGHIGVESEPGHGSTFTIEIPLARA
jgi:signal transduction histidine kinase